MSKYTTTYKLTVIYTRMDFTAPTQKIVTSEEQKIMGKNQQTIIDQI